MMRERGRALGGAALDTDTGASAAARPSLRTAVADARSERVEPRSRYGQYTAGTLRSCGIGKVNQPPKALEGTWSANHCQSTSC